MNKNQRAMWELNESSKWVRGSKIYESIFNTNQWVIIRCCETNLEQTWRLDDGAPKHFLDCFEIYEGPNLLDNNINIGPISDRFFQ